MLWRYMLISLDSELLQLAAESLQMATRKKELSGGGGRNNLKGNHL